MNVDELVEKIEDLDLQNRIKKAFIEYSIFKRNGWYTFVSQRTYQPIFYFASESRL